MSLLSDKQVLQWLRGDTSFLSALSERKRSKEEVRQEMKKLEDAWGMDLMRKSCPHLKFESQWTNKFGEMIVQEFLSEKSWVPKSKQGFKPDLETDEYVIEVKTQTYFTSGTAGEKILGCPFKYCDIPELWGKPLKIICLGGAEKICREEYGNLPGEKTSKNKQKILDFYKEMGIEYWAMTDLIKDL